MSGRMRHSCNVLPASTEIMLPTAVVATTVDTAVLSACDVEVSTLRVMLMTGVSTVNVFLSVRGNDNVSVGFSIDCDPGCVQVASSVPSVVNVFVGNRGDDIVEVASCVPSVVNVNVFVGDRAKDNVSVRS